jgi:hypothetical protein
MKDLQVRRSFMWERASLSPMLFCHCHLWLRSWGRYLGTTGCSWSDPDQFFFCRFVLFCLFALWPRYLVLLYQLKACNLKITLPVRGSKATKRAWMARGGTLVESWMGTFDEQTFVPLYTLWDIYILWKERENLKALFFCCDLCLLFSPEGRIWEPA